MIDQGELYEKKMLQIVRLAKEKTEELVVRVTDVLLLSKEVFEMTQVRLMNDEQKVKNGYLLQ